MRDVPLRGALVCLALVCACGGRVAEGRAPRSPPDAGAANAISDAASAAEAGEGADAGSSASDASADAEAGPDASCPPGVIYLLTQSPGRTTESLITFDPVAGAFTDRGPLCPGGGILEEALAVDSQGAVYVPYEGQSRIGGIYRVDPTTVQCADSGFAVGTSMPHLDRIYGMTFAISGTPAREVLYFIAGTGYPGQPYFFAAADPVKSPWRAIDSSLPIANPSTPLAGTGNSLFTQGTISPLNDHGGTTLVRIDATTGAVTPLRPGPGAGDWPPPFVLWNGDFYFFTLFGPGPVTRASVDGSVSTIVATTTQTVVAAATRPCPAP